MKKIVKAGAVITAVTVGIASLSVTSIAEETAENRILLYEDMENVTLAENFEFTRNRDWVYQNALGNFSKQYIYGIKDGYYNNQDISIITEADGNKVFNIKNTSDEVKPSNDANMAKVWMKFDSPWVLDKTADEKLVVAYDISAKEFYSTANELRFYGSMLADANGNKYSMWKNDTYAGGIMQKIARDENGNVKSLSYSMRNTNGAAWDGSNSTNVNDVKLGDTVRVIQIVEKYEKDTPAYAIVMHAPNENPKRSPVAYNYTDLQNPTEINSVYFIGQMGVEYSVDNVKAYTIPQNAVLKVISSDAADVPVTSALEVKLNGYIPETQLSKIAVKIGDEIVDSSKYAVTVKENTKAVESTISVKFNEKMNFGTTYTICLPKDFLDETHNVLGTETNVNFTTQSAPSFDIELTANKTLQEAAGSMILCDINVTHTTARASSGTIFVGLYDSENNIIGYGSTDKQYVPNEKDSVKVSLEIPKNTAGLTLKAFCCESLSKLDNIFSDIVTLQ